MATNPDVRSAVGQDIPDPAPRSAPRLLDGFTVGVTASRRAQDLGVMLTRLGADVSYAPVLRAVLLDDDASRLRATAAVIAAPPDVVVGTTGIGFRGWMDSAHDDGVFDELIAALRRSRVIARGPKVVGAMRAAGVCEGWAPQSESCAEVLDVLVAGGVVGRRIAVQIPGSAPGWTAATDLCVGLREAGAVVIEIPVYRWRVAADPAPVQRMVESIADGVIDAVTFTSAPAVSVFLAHAAAMGQLDRVLRSLRTTVVPLCVGPVTAGQLERVGVPARRPLRARLGALAGLVGDTLPGVHGSVVAGGHEVTIHAATVRVDGEVRTPTRSAMSLLKMLAAQPGVVVSRAALLTVLHGTAGDGHALDAGISRLRSTLGAYSIIESRPGIGYRLAVESGPAGPADRSRSTLVH